MPRYGYALETEGAIVGAVLLMFSSRKDLPGPRCNIASWYVMPEHRGHAAMLSAMALKHKTVTYLNVTPAANTWPILEAQGYRRYCKGLLLSFPALSASSDAVVQSVSPETHTIPGLSDAEFENLREQLAYGCICLVVRKNDQVMPFVFLPFRIRGGKIPLPLAQLVYCRKTSDFVACGGALGRALLRHGKMGVLVDSDGPIAGLRGFFTESRGRKYCKGPGTVRMGDLLDTELVIFGP